MTDDNLYKDYLCDYALLLREAAEDAKKRSKQEPSLFMDGYVDGIRRSLVILTKQAESFGVELAEIGLSGFDPEVDV